MSCHATTWNASSLTTTRIRQHWWQHLVLWRQHLRIFTYVYGTSNDDLLTIFTNTSAIPSAHRARQKVRVLTALRVLLKIVQDRMMKESWIMQHVVWLFIACMSQDSVRQLAAELLRDEVVESVLMGVYWHCPCVTVYNLFMCTCV